jgi:hypothetical protein
MSEMVMVFGACVCIVCLASGIFLYWESSSRAQDRKVIWDKLERARPRLQGQKPENALRIHREVGLDESIRVTFVKESDPRNNQELKGREILWTLGPDGTIDETSTYSIGDGF